jgi:hypothetical protein
MLSDKAIAYALVDLFEFDTVRLQSPEDALQVMGHAGVPCALGREGEGWCVRLHDDVIAARARRRARGGDPRRGLGLEGVA